MALCNIPSHRHGAKLAQGFTECGGHRGGMHQFTGRVILLRTDAIPLHICDKCGLVAAYYQCNGEVK